MNWNLKKRDTVNWKHHMPRPKAQEEGLLPNSWQGACVPAAYSDALTARLRKAHPNHNFEVDRTALIHSSAGRGVLNERGASPFFIGILGICSGIPLKGNVPGAEGMQLDPGRPAYALGINVKSYKAIPLSPFCSPDTLAQCFNAMKYREHLCEQLDEGPIIVCLHLQKHWAGPRADDEPYRPLPGNEHWLTRQLSNGEEVPIGHCVAVYGYSCPGGDVNSLVLYCQDNMIGTPELICMSPNAVDAYSVPIIDDFTIIQDPMPGNELTEELRLARSAQDSTSWNKIRNIFYDFYSSPTLPDKVPSMKNCHAFTILTTNNKGHWEDVEFKICYYGGQGQPTTIDRVHHLIKGNVIFTPAFRGTILPCITRKGSTEIAQSNGFKVKKLLVSVDELPNTGDVISNATAVGVSPLDLVKRVGYGKQGIGVAS